MIGLWEWKEEVTEQDLSNLSSLSSLSKQVSKLRRG
jgi:hypothetical protein